MDAQDGVWRAAWKGASRRARDLGRSAADLILPPLAHDSREATAAAGLTPVEEDDRARRIRLGYDMHICPLGKVVSREEWEKSLDELNER